MRRRNSESRKRSAVAVATLAGKGAVEVDHMQPCKTLICEESRLDGRFGVVDGRPLHVAELQPHAFAVFQVDGRKEDHGFHFKKFEIRARPKRWLFSG